MTQDTSGSYLAIASVVATILARFSVSTDAQSIVMVISGAVALYGIIRQLLAHKKLAHAAKQAGISLQ